MQVFLAFFRKSLKGLGLGILALSAVGAAKPVLADQADVKAAFTVTLSGVMIGKGSFEANVTPEGYSIGVAAKITGLARIVAAGEGSATARGHYSGEHISPAVYSIQNTVADIRNAVTLNMHGNAITSESVSPPTPFHVSRIPLTPAAKRGIVDPLSAFLVPVEYDEALNPGNCERTLKIYDGRQRYDIAMAFSRIEQQRSVGDFEGAALVCKAAWRPIAGHKADATKMMEENRDVEAWLTPIPGTRFMVISRMTIGTSVGQLVISANRVSVTPGRQASLR